MKAPRSDALTLSPSVIELLSFTVGAVDDVCAVVEVVELVDADALDAEPPALPPLETLTEPESVALTEAESVVEIFVESDTT